MSSKFRYLNIDVLDEIAEIDSDVVKEIIEIFADTSPDILLKMKNLAHQGGYQELGREIHSFKSTCGNLGITPMYTACKTLESNIKGGGFQTQKSNSLFYSFVTFSKLLL